MENHGFTLRHFQSVEAGKSINLVTAKRLAAAFGIDVSDLLKGLSRRARLLAAENVAESAKAWRRRPGRPTKTKK